MLADVREWHRQLPHSLLQLSLFSPSFGVDGVETPPILARRPVPHWQARRGSAESQLARRLGPGLRRLLTIFSYKK